MPVTDADRLVAAGIPLTLGGREVRVRYTLRSWKEAEDRFETTANVLGLLRGLTTPNHPEAIEVKKDVGTVIPLLWCGLLHEGLTLDDVFELGNMRDLRIYVDAIMDAVSEGTPGPGSGKEGAVGEMAASPGPTTTTPSPSDTAAAMASSGA